MGEHMGSWTGIDSRFEEPLGGNTPEQRASALRVVSSFADTATLPELVAMLGLGES